MSNNNHKKPEATEEEFLRFFFDNARVPAQERIFLEEGFEICFNFRVPDHLKVNLMKVAPDTARTVPAPPPIDLIPSDRPTVIELPPMVDEVSPDTMEDPSIPAPPRLPSMTLMGQVLLDNAENGDYVLMNKQSGEHVSLGALIDQLKEMTGIE